MTSDILLPGLILFVVVYSFFKNKESYASFLKGVKNGLSLFSDVYPTMLAMNFAIHLLRNTKILTLVSSLFSSIFTFVPGCIFPMALFRPLSGSVTLALMGDIFETYGVDSLEGIMASIIQGSTDTTFYVISLYFAHVGVKHIKNSLWIGLIADFAGISAAILLSIAFFS